MLENMCYQREDVVQIDTDQKGKMFVLPYEALQLPSEGNDFIDSIFLFFWVQYSCPDVCGRSGFFFKFSLLF